MAPFQLFQHRRLSAGFLSSSRSLVTRWSSSRVLGRWFTS
eukprot:CAMPEP_0175675530 /NCGR_PEP_ID=MMETSP0097-20121207/22276_1 /TAXON_ID=311494 /ORGANISM="Alexandrium monilatum, Strain CCMP3105" /LENGTH=39 /DNA_ID= /DNA_START= /DNA_END= /DNA_ORIENTATION=